MRVIARLLIIALVVVATQHTLAAQGSAPQVYTPGDGVSLPVPVTRVIPQYTPEARDARIEGTVVLDCVVLADGTVGDVSVARSLDSVLGLDQQAVNASKQWTFKPGTKDGKPVAVRVQIEINFTLR
jgi:protein TonB